MKIATLILLLVCAVSVIVAAASYLSASGSHRLLATMQMIRPGSTHQEVRELLRRETSVAPANAAPHWIEEVCPKSETGEYWYCYMGYPPRNLIIYFDDNGRVVYTTWAWT